MNTCFTHTHAHTAHSQNLHVKMKKKKNKHAIMFRAHPSSLESEPPRPDFKNLRMRRKNPYLGLISTQQIEQLKDSLFFFFF